MAVELQVGDEAPAFKSIAVGGEYGEGAKVALDDFKGRKVVLYFYPKDDTPGCTVQACAIRDAWPEIQAKAALFGVSPDPIKSHVKFQAKHALPFPLLADDHHEMVEAYGVWVEKSMYGKKYWGTERSTFVIGEDGRIAAIFRKVQPAEHVGLVLGAL